MRPALIKIKNLVIKAFILILMSISMIILSLAAAGKLDIIPLDSILSSFDYIPLLWIFVVILPVTVSLLVISYRSTAFISFSVFTLFSLFFGDYSFTGVNSEESDFNQNDYVECNDI